jgi:hypothetical protein
MGWEEIVMLQHTISKAVAAVLALATMTTVALAGPLGSPQQSKAQSGGIRPAAFIWDGGVTLFPNIPNFAFFLRGGIWVDSNNVVWTPLACCIYGRSSIGLAADGIFFEPSGVYGAPIVYDGGYNTLLVPF